MIKLNFIYKYMETLLDTWCMYSYQKDMCRDVLIKNKLSSTKRLDQSDPAIV